MPRKTEKQKKAESLIKSKVCPSCYLGLPPQTYNEILQSNGTAFCPHCQHPLVLEAHNKDEK